MKKHLDVIKQTLELSETMGEALVYIKAQVNQGLVDNTIQLVNDTMTAFASIIQSMRGFVDELPPNQIQQRTDTLVQGLEVLTTAYEQQQSGKILEVLQFTVLPAYKQWSDELVKHLQPYILT